MFVKSGKRIVAIEYSIWKISHSFKSKHIFDVGIVSNYDKIVRVDPRVVFFN